MSVRVSSIARLVSGALSFLLAWGGFCEVSLSEDLPGVIALKSTSPNSSGEHAPAYQSRVRYSSSLSGGLLEDLLLAKVYEHDDTLQRIERKLGLTNTIVPFLTGTVIGGTALSQNIATLNLIGETQPRLTERRLVAITGITGQSVLLTSLTVLGAVRFRYKRQVKKRQSMLKAQVREILGRLSAGEDPGMIEGEIAGLAGEVAGREFMGLWRHLYSEP